MQLTALEIKGFKSFADKTTIHFNNRITGIVGPNGCGKSNVVDSIRWVLGEQKTSMLRLEKMENLIFNGTRHRKPAGLAEVSLTFENTKNVLSSDYKTITITRKLFRDGESEYRLNNVPCRLKDITGLFMDTGVSSDSYAIIELAMVDEILNDRDNSRRKLFEQAAGIAKYKKRKKETIEKLKNTDADLERVKDLLFEIETNLKTLEKQAQKTKKFYELREEYKQLSLLLAHFTLQDYKTTYQQLEEDRQKHETAKTEVEARIAKAEASLEKEKFNNIERENTLFAIQKQLNEWLSGVSDKENERNLLQSQLKYARDKAETAQKAITEANEQKEKLQLSIEKLIIEKESENRLLESKKSELANLETQLQQTRAQHQTIKETLSREQQLYAENERQIFELDKKLAVNRSGNEALQRDLFQSEEEVVNKRQELEKLQTELTRLNDEKQIAEEKLQALLQQEELNKKQLSEIELIIEKKRLELTSETRLLDAKRNEWELTKSMVENMEGFPEAIKFLKKNARWAKDAPLLSDLIYCTEEYRIAIENYLEPFLSYYVVQNFQEAFSAVNLLNDASKGKANFFILEDFEHYEPCQPVILPGAIAATEVVELDSKYRKLGAYLLDKVYLIDDSKSFNTAEHLHPRQKIILLTKSGRYMRQEFSLSGGSVGLFEGKKIGRAKNLEKLQKEIVALEKKTRKLHSDISELQTTAHKIKSSTLPRETETQRSMVSQICNLYSATQASIQSLVKFLESADAKSKSITERLEALRHEVTAINEQLNTLHIRQTTLKNQLDQAEKNFAQITNQLSEVSSLFNQKNIEFHQQQNRVNSLAQELQFKNSQIESLTLQLSRNRAVVEECQQVVAEASAQLKMIESELLAGYSNKDAIEKQMAEAEKAYYDSRAKIQDGEALLRDEHRKKEQLNTLLASIHERVNELKLSLTGLKERLHVEFNVDINELIQREADSKLSKEEVEQEVMKIKKRLEGFGEINPMAVEAYDEMKSRYDFIIAQRQDLEVAKSSLLSTIKEIDETAKHQFIEAFGKVRENFVKVFRTLFSEEDQCDLFLVNPDDPLESKIEIVAKPKGKRPTVIDQLSGGEKTLTATALLFALYLLKPAPFCIFDEVDAPLDDTNITKFNKIIQEFSKDSQFIIVTHNKNTMSAVDAIYGVTMPEMGVSKVVPVNFSSLN
jgi:chromosome segregation protein